MRLFYALTFTPESRKAISLCQDQLTKVAKRNHLVDADNFHITLEFVGEVCQESLDRYIKVIEQLTLEQSDVEVTGLGAFGRGGEKLIWLAIKPHPWLMKLQSSLKDELIKLGFKPETRQYIPHITLARHTKLQCELSEIAITPQRLKLYSIALLESCRQGTSVKYITRKQKLL
ncbi:RNA 2',3'-cyclic phosphodiesterase [Vibrio rhodolitus]|uniref:RNA 2',3'-cyclic phosphodiesterase n=1 Tax=Vibrio rhodolitus TaxID=2231649 RepID=UPI000E0A36EE|nr:RNA 2',3'-cyclic phosphodiesterase [Vibrio rhodolitus]